MSETTPEESGRNDRRPSGPPRGKPSRPGAARGGSGSRPPARSGGPAASRGRSAARPYGKGQSGERSGGRSAAGSEPDGRSGDRPYGKGRSGERSGDRPYGTERSGDRPYGKERSGDRPYGKERSGDRPVGKGRSGERSGDRPYGNERSGERSGDRPYSKQRSGERSYGSGKQGERPYGDRAPAAGRSSERRSDRPYGASAPRGGTSDRGPRKAGPAGRGAPRGDDGAPWADARSGERPAGRSRSTGRGGERGYGDRPTGQRTTAARGDRPATDRPYGKGKPAGRGSERSSGTWSSGERTSERPYRKDKPAERGAPRSFDRSRPDARTGERPYGKGREADRPREAPRPGLAAKADEPETPKGLDLRELPRGVRAELRGLPTDRAEAVGAHLLMAGRLVDTDPQLAYAHAEAARRRAARLPITREAAAETAYAAGDYQVALSEFRALRRMRGGDEYLPAMADCERALRRHQAALKLIREGLAANPEVPQVVELRLVEAGVRVDTGQPDEALRVLKAEIERIGARGPKVSRARLRYAYADLLERTGEGEAAERWFDAVVRLDPDQSTDAEDRLAALRGLVIEYVDEDEDDVEDSDDVEDEVPAAEPSE